MKRILFLIAILSFSIISNAQPYSIGFSGTGASSSVSTVKVDNLTAGTTLTINGEDILSLTITTEVLSEQTDKKSEINIYPNPILEYSLMKFRPPVAGSAVISIFDMTGRTLFQTANYLDGSEHVFKLSGFKVGLYLISITGSKYHLSHQVLCTKKSNGYINIENTGNNIQSNYTKDTELVSKGDQSTVEMEYSAGDRLKFTGISGNYSTVITDIPTEDKTITFSFMACTDGDGNNYPVVQIGQQFWMAENLNTKKYKNGSDIQLMTEDEAWSSTTVGAYCDHGNNPSNSSIYGRLYNWYAAFDIRNICPGGWHVPLDLEWSALADFLGEATSAGGKLKEIGTAHWLDPNTGASDETGFTALPASFRMNLGEFGNLGMSTTWWSSELSYYHGYILYNSSDLVFDNSQPGYGYSVRCMKDDPDYDYDNDGYTIDEGDCNDFNGSIHPGVIEICEDGIDQDCDGSDPACSPLYFDDDGDGFSEVQGDCDDSDDAIYPGALEISGNGKDDDCDGVVDEQDLVKINEVDYDQPGTDIAEYVELYNASLSPNSLIGWKLEFINGNGFVVYYTCDLSGIGTMPAHSFYTIQSPWIPSTNAIQNGPDAIILRDSNGTIIDALAYGDYLGPEGGEGTPSIEDTGVGDFSIGRYPDGEDTDNNIDDFYIMTLTPGSTNVK